MLLVVAHGLTAEDALVDLTEAASRGGSSIVDVRWCAGASGFILIIRVSVNGGAVASASATAALQAVARRLNVTLSVYPAS